MEEGPESKQKLSAEDEENLRRAQLAYMEYISRFASAEFEQMEEQQRIFSDAVSKLSPEGKRALDDFFRSRPEGEQPSNIDLEY